MSTEVDGKPADPPLNGSASSYSGVSPLRSLRQMFPKTLSDKYRYVILVILGACV